jgi:hypothetical protein
MQQIADWLQKLGLGQYTPRIAENDIATVLPWCILSRRCASATGRAAYSKGGLE